MPKTIEDLKKSRKIRKQFISKYGEILTSVWENLYNKFKDGIFQYDERKQDKVALKRHEKMNYDKTNPELIEAFSMSSKNVRGTSEEAGLSTFPPKLAERVIKFYSELNDTILDPFAGHNSRMQVAYQLNRNYIGYDVSHKFMEFNRKVVKEIVGEGLQNQLFTSDNKIILREQSSEKLLESDNSIDCIFTSPPYYKIEFYTSEPEQLFYSKTYDEFLQRMKTIIKECYRVLKNNKFCIFNINDFRYNNKFYTYHCDIVRLFEEVGFRLWDIIIIKWNSSIAACFASQIEERKVCGKMHEYLIVGKKYNG